MAFLAIHIILPTSLILLRITPTSFTKKPPFPIYPTRTLVFSYYPVPFPPFSVFTSPLHKRVFPISLVGQLVLCYFPLYFYPIPLSWQWPRFTFLGSIVTVGYVFTSEGLELRASDERNHAVFVFLGLCYLT